MNAPADAVILKQHLIDPEICIRCNTCEATCPVGAITHDARNYVVDPAKCEFCLACIPPCPTGAIDQWRKVLRIKAYTVAEQFAWDALPAEQSAAELAQAAAAAGVSADVADVPAAAPGSASAAAQAGVAGEAAQFHAAQYGATVPPWSAAHPYTQLYGPKAAQKSVTATVVGNVRVTDVGTDYDTHHVMLDFGSMPFPVLEGQSIGVIPPGTDEQGRPHHARQYSIASPRNGERAGYNNLSLAVKRVLEDHQGRPVRGVASNYMCDLKLGDTRVDAAGVWLAVLSGAGASAIGYAIWYTALPALKATSAATVQLSVPVLATLGGILWLGEAVSPRLVLASVAILGGIALVILEKKKAAGAASR